MHAERVGRVIVALDGRGWMTFDALREVLPVWSALDSKQYTGTLMALKNRGLVEQRIRHEEPCVTEWRLAQADS